MSDNTRTGFVISLFKFKSHNQPYTPESPKILEFTQLEYYGRYITLVSNYNEITSFFKVVLLIRIRAMFGMFGGCDTMTENLSGCLFTLGYYCIREFFLFFGGGGGRGETELISVRGRRLPVGVPPNVLAHRLLN